MSTPLFHHQEPFAASGNAFGKSAAKALGRPTISSWEMFTRESLQNSWDARDRTLTTDGVTFAIDYVSLSRQKSEFLRKTLLSPTAHDSLAQALSVDRISLLMVCDTGTYGLRGPTVANIATDSSDDFVSFVRNIGRSEDKAVAGGTYGFGKGVFFDASPTNTVLIYTRTTDEHGERVNRFIAMANTDAFEAQGSRFTGRHWWGNEATSTNPDGTTSHYAEPITGVQADDIAAQLGMDRYFTEERATGTTVAVIAPHETIDSAAELSSPNSTAVMEVVLSEIAGALTKWAWPHMVDSHEDMDPIDFAVHYDGRDVKIPNPSGDPLLRHYVSAYKAALTVTDGLEESFSPYRLSQVTAIASGRPKAHIGSLGMSVILDPVEAEKTLLAESHGRHVALIRAPRMVVEYKRFSESPTSQGYAGVFLVSNPDMDALFARSEPTAHDTWNPKTLRARPNYVSIAIDHINSLVREGDIGAKKRSGGQHHNAVVQLADTLGGLFEGTGLDANGTRVKPSSRRRQVTSAPAPKHRPRATANFDGLQLINDTPMALFSVDVTAPDDSYPLILEMTPRVVLDRGNEENPNDGLPLPKVYGWWFNQASPLIQATDRTELGRTQMLLEASPVHPITVAVVQPADTAVGIAVSLQAPSSADEEDTSHA